MQKSRGCFPCAAPLLSFFMSYALLSHWQPPQHEKKGNRNAPHSNCPTAALVATRHPRGSRILSSSPSYCCRLTPDLTHSIPALNYYVSFKGHRETLSSSGPFKCLKRELKKIKILSPERRFGGLEVLEFPPAVTVHLFYSLCASSTCVEFSFRVAPPPKVLTKAPFSCPHLL